MRNFGYNEMNGSFFKNRVNWFKNGWCIVMKKFFSEIVKIDCVLKNYY